MNPIKWLKQVTEPNWSVLLLALTCFIVGILFGG